VRVARVGYFGFQVVSIAFWALGRRAHPIGFQGFAPGEGESAVFT
jgi:hypothetical protein